MTLDDKIGYNSRRSKGKKYNQPMIYKPEGTEIYKMKCAIGHKDCKEKQEEVFEYCTTVCHKMPKIK